MRPPLRDPDDPANPPTPTAAASGADPATRVEAAPADLLAIIDPIPDVEPVDNPFGLSAKQLLFVEAYVGVANFRAVDAYRLAGFSGKGGMGRANASKLLTLPRVEAAIAAKLQARVKALRIMGGEEALERLSLHARFDVRRMFPGDKQLAEMPDEVALAIKSVYPTKFGRRFEMYDGQRAAELLAKAGGALKDVVKVEHSLEDIMALANRPDPGAAA